MVSDVDREDAIAIKIKRCRKYSDTFSFAVIYCMFDPVPIPEDALDILVCP